MTIATVPGPVRPEKFLPVLLLATLACSSTTESLPTVTLLVTNATCNTGQCTPIEALGFPSNQPHTPGGFWSIDLGLVTGASACLTLPPSGEFRVGNASTGASTVYSWTVADSLALSAEPAPADRLRAVPITGPFVPAGAAGWSIILPSGTGLSKSRACTP
jgi:hypothetical protein